MSGLRCMRLLACPTTTSSTLLRASMNRIAVPQSAFTSQARPLSILALRRPTLQTSTTLLNSSCATPAIPNPETLDLLPKVSTHPGLAATQIRCGPRDTYSPSHLVRKRRHGWLSRIRTKNGRKLLMRRIKKRRWNLSH
ncbi:hypothetical protein CC78DRAFT_492067 [Lojkania enalia]|uniref:Large ribosomal subunit protein bL34m n=1 Tax=Lojkania enalia TaxID=147567 RepID=A0A9P4KDV3_9PLEO|nr:hypothetical protein CC78DRAFT_492067 [Didymosphaeria enalia]